MEINGTSHVKLPFPGFVDPGLPSKCTWKPGSTAKDPHNHIEPHDRSHILPSILHAIGQTPLVRLNQIPKTEGVQCEILAKCEFLNPGGSLKDRIGFRMVEEAEAEGRLKPGCTLVEPTSGNTGVGIALAAAVKGYKCIIVMSQKMSSEKVYTLQALGAEVVRTPISAGSYAPDGLMAKAQLIARDIPFEHVVGAAYVRNHVTPDLKHEAYKMVKMIDHEFRKYISEVSWMDKQTSSKAKRKAENIFYHIGYPDELFDENVLEEYYKEVNVTGDLLFTVLNLQEWESRRAFSLLRSKVNKTRWEIHSDVTDVNAFYIDDQNAVEIPAGILQDVFYSPHRPNSLNMGAIGAVIAHELTHSIDDEGKQYDHKGNLKQWWDHETDRHFKHRAQAIVSAYSKYTVKAVNMTLNGVNVQGEMIADHGGLKLAYNAYRSSKDGNYSGPRLANLEHFTPDQLFWLSYANSWCAKERPESIRSGIISDVHPPAEVRVNGPFRNSEIFARDWVCPPHSFMNPRKKHNVW